MSQDTAANAPQETPETASATTSDALFSPFCRELRTKRYYFLDGMATEESQLLDGSNRCWCGRTMQAYGPDGEMVYTADCKPGRSCYKSLFE